MLLRAARSPCWRPGQYAYLSCASRAAWRRPATTQLRIFTTSGRLLNQSTDGKDPSTVKPGSTAVPTSPFTQLEGQPSKEGDGKTTAKKDFMSESKANKEQRKADWAIMREMAKYLWPKVMSLAFHEVQSADRARRMTGVQSFVLGQHSHCWLAQRLELS